MFKIEEIWLLLDKYTFATEPDSELNCVICHKLLNNAHQGPCGCTYCKTCIEHYVRNGNVYCPGMFYNCATEKLELGRNIIIDHSANRRVSLLDVQCPLDSCNYHRKLMEMSNHVRMCDKRLISCPFADMGCLAGEMRNETLSTHLLEDINEHHNLMVEWMANMRNDVTANIIDQQHQIFDNQYSDFQQLINDKITQAKQDNDNAIQLSCDNLTEQIQELQSKNNELKQLIKEVNDKVRRASSALSDETDTKIDDLMKQNGEMMNELNRLRLEKDEIMNKHLEIRSEINSERADSSVRGAMSRGNRIDEVSLQQQQQRQPIGATRDEISYSQSTSSDLNVQMEKLGSLMWHFMGISKIGRLPIESDKFHSTNRRYRMWLQLQNLGGHVDRIGVRLIVNDGNEAVWPLNCVVVMTIRSIVKSNFSKITWQRHLKYVGPLGDISRSLLLTPHQFLFSKADLNLLSDQDNDSIMIECEIYAVP